MAKRKSTEYGKRYSVEAKQAIMRAWHEELWKNAPKTKSEFARSHGISTITLDKWLSSADAPPLSQVTQRPGGNADGQAVENGQAHEESRDSVANLIRAIKQHQASIDELKSRLRHWVDAL